jgi:phage baseplate assembly protein V
MVKNNLQIGTIKEVDNTKGVAIIYADGRPSDWLPIRVASATPSKKHYISLSNGDQVLVINPHGENRQGYILTGLYYEGLEPPKGIRDDVEITEYSDGTVITFDLKEKTYNADFKSDVTVKAPSIKLDSDVTITGTLTVDKTISDQRGDLTNHHHLGFVGTAELERT